MNDKKINELINDIQSNRIQPSMIKISKGSLYSNYDLTLFNDFVKRIDLTDISIEINSHIEKREKYDLKLNKVYEQINDIEHLIEDGEEYDDDGNSLEEVLGIKEFQRDKFQRKFNQASIKISRYNLDDVTIRIIEDYYLELKEKE